MKKETKRMKKSGIMVDEVSGKKYVLLKWNQKPDGSKGDQFQTSLGTWISTAETGTLTAKEARATSVTQPDRKYRRPLPE